MTNNINVIHIYIIMTNIELLCDLKKYMLYDIPPQLSIPIEINVRNIKPITNQSPTITIQPPTITNQSPTITNQTPTIKIQPSIITNQTPTIKIQPSIITNKSPTITIQPSTITIQPSTITIQPSPITTTNPINIIYQKDTLFWSFYKIINDELPNIINIASEKTLKIHYVEEIRKHKELIKKYKFASLVHIENQLANESILDINTFIVLCLIKNINVVYVKNKTYFECVINDTLPIYIIYFLAKNKYGYSAITDKTVYNTLYKIDSINKPIKAMSYYKIADLIDICNKLMIDTTDLKNKKHLYDAIIQKID
jgi:hypothetical protein